MHKQLYRHRLGLDRRARLGRKDSREQQQTALRRRMGRQRRQLQ